jgi:transposase-like protein
MRDAYNHRLRLVESARQRGIKPTARLFQTTPPTVRKWLRRFQQQGPRGLVELSRAPHHHPNQTSPEIEQLEMSQRISSAIRNFDVLVRWGGEEFLVVSRYTDRQEAETLALRVLCAVREKPYGIAAGCEVRRTCSMGWAAFPWCHAQVVPNVMARLGYSRQPLRLVDCD